MASHIPHPHSSSHKGAGYAFSLNLVRSLGLWSPHASFPSDVQKPAYLCLNAANNTVDWTEQLRKYSKHNTDKSAQIRAATTRLELLVWRAIEHRTSKSKYLEVQKKRFDRRRRNVKRTQLASPLQENEGTSGIASTQAGADHNANGNLQSSRRQHPSPPDELLVKAAAARQEIKSASHEVQKAIANSQDSPEVREAHIILALAAHATGDYGTCVQHLPEEQPGFVSRPNAASHDLDLQILAILLKGMSLEQLAAQNVSVLSGPEPAIAVYRSLPLSPPPPIPEAQRYVEMGLSRLAILDYYQSLDSYRQYFGLTATFKTISPAKRLVMYRSYLSALLDQLQDVAQTGHDDHGDTHSNTNDAFPLIRAYEQLLFASPSLARFPKAGEATPNMYDYMDIIFAYWDLGVLPGKFVIESLYRALSKTYACQRLHRYLIIVCSTLSFIENDRQTGKEHALDALRNLRLYIALFEKSRETDQQAVQEELRRYRRDHGEISSSGGEETDEEGMISTSGAKMYNPSERDEDFCRVACIGTRLLLTESRQDGKQEQEDERIDLIHEALGIIEKAKKITEHKQPRTREKDKITGQDSSEKPARNDSHRGSTKEQRAIHSEVLTWLGVARAEWALAEADPEQSRDRAKTALADLQAAVELLPSPVAPTTPMYDAAQMPRQPSEATRAVRTRALYCLAYAQLEARDVASAVATAKQAIDCNNSSGHSTESSTHTFTMCDNSKIWHLFVLALTARKDWSRAQEVANLALYGEQDAPGDEENDTIENNCSSSPTSPKSPRALSDEDAPRPPGPTRQFTRADAPYDPSATGTNAAAMQSAKQSASPARKSSPSGKTEDATSSFVNIQLPDGSDGSPANGISSSIGRTRSPSIAVSTQGSTAGRFAERRTEPMTLRTTSPWDDLEAEIDFMITRNKCIEAVEGPELALQDLQANVFTRFSKKRDDLESIVDSKPADETYGQSPRSAVSASTYPYPSSSMQQDNVRLQRQLDEYSSRQGEQPHGRARSLLGSISLRHRRSRANTAARQERSATVNSISHLTVPETGSTRPASIRSVGSSGGVVSAQMNGAALADTPNSARSSGQGERTASVALQPSKPLPAQAARILSRLWLTSAATFRRWGKLDECRGAINEAEDAAGDVDPDIWMQYALYLKTAGEDKEDIAQLAMSKALGMCTDHIPTCLLISKTHLDRGNWAIAEGFLDTATQANAWDSPEAWYLLAKVYENTRRRQRARECLLYALELEKTRPIRELRATLPRFI